MKILIALNACNLNIWCLEYQEPIVTEVESLTKFYEAENYHQNYYERNKSDGYCRVIISPKLQKLREKYSDKLQAV